MTIRAKLYAAIVLTVLGPLATTAVALHGMAQLGDRFDEVRERAEHEAVARELKFLVTDVNGWQTAYGYAGGELRAAVRGLGERAAQRARRWRPTTLTDPREQRAARPARARSSTAFMELDAVAWRELQAGRRGDEREILLGPELERFEAMAATAERAGRLRGGGGGGHRRRLRRGTRRRPPAPGRGRARRRRW